MNFIHLYQMYKHRINIKLSYILEKLPFQQSNLLKAMKYSTLLGGKRLRACLVYSTGELFKVNLATLDVISIVIECIHAYSLIHDDLPCMDNDSIRRGKSACHIKYGEYVSLLAGDALQSFAFNVLSNNFMPNVSHLKRIKMIVELSSTIGASGMCMGQMLDLEKEGVEIDLSRLQKINLYKTAFLMRCSARLVYLSSKNSSKIVLSVLDRFSSSIGLAFQIQDDILDFNNDSLKIKNNRINKRKIQKNTYPLIIGVYESHKKIKQLYEEAFIALEILRKKNFDINILEKLTQFIIKRIT